MMYICRICLRVASHLRVGHVVFGPNATKFQPTLALGPALSTKFNKIVVEPIFPYVKALGSKIGPTVYIPLKFQPLLALEKNVFFLINFKFNEIFTQIQTQSLSLHIW